MVFLFYFLIFYKNNTLTSGGDEGSTWNGMITNKIYLYKFILIIKIYLNKY